ncbi:MAG: 16S rRNA processing protein RimM [Chloroflexi bacterium]|nr:16S rRNA processing protein RimM [Chloroflexota bacterium]
MTDAPLLLTIGRVLKPWSYRGELKIEVLSDFPDRFASLREVFLGDDAKSFQVERAHQHGKFILLKLVGVDSEADAEKLREQYIYVTRENAVPLKPNQVYLYQTIGMRVVTVQGQDLGEVVDILDTPAHDVYVVHDGAREILIPAVPEFIREINLESKRLVVKLIDGLLDL